MKARPSMKMVFMIFAPFVSYASDSQGFLTLIRTIQVDELGVAGAIDGCAFSTDGSLVAASDNHGNTKVYDVGTGEMIQSVYHAESEVRMRNGETNAIHFSPDDKLMLTGMNDTGCKIWNLKTGEMVKNLGHGRNTDGAAFSPNGKWVAVAHDDIAAVYRIRDYKKVWELKHPKTEVNSVDWSTDSKHLVTGSDGGGIRISKVDLWDVLYAHDFGVNRVKSIRISPDGKFVVASGQEARVLVYRMSDGRIQAQLPHPSYLAALPGDDYDDPPEEANVEAVEWSNDSRYVFTGGTYDGTIRVWRVSDWKQVAAVQGQEYNRQVEFLATSKNGLLASGGDEGVLYIFKFNSR